MDKRPEANAGNKLTKFSKTLSLHLPIHMKKVLLFILAVAYLTTSSGGIIYLHQCMGKLSCVDFGISNSGNGKCGKCGMEKNKAGDCCQDHLIVLKSLQDQNQPVYFSQKINLFPSFIPFIFPENKPIYFANNLKQTFSSNISHHHNPPDFQAFYRCILI